MRTLFGAAALALVVNVSALTVPATAGPYTFVSCWTDSNSVRTLANEETNAALGGNSNQTAGNCAGICEALGYTVMGTEYAYECFCGNAVATSSTSAPFSDCSKPCYGNSGEACGGSGYLSLYAINGTSNAAFSAYNAAQAKLPSTTATTTTTTTTTYAGEASETVDPLYAGYGYNFVGCYTDSSASISTRTLANQLTNAATGGDKNQTIENCATACYNKGYSYMGLEYYYQCFCDNQINNSPTMVALSNCNAPCYGNNAEMCGGTGGGGVGYLSLYAIGGIYGGNPAVTSTAEINPTYTGTPINLEWANPGGYKFLGCFTDYFSTGGSHTLEYPYLGNVMYIEECAYLCNTYYTAGSYIGLYNGDNCYCGTGILPNNILVTATTGFDCNAVCENNGTEICGGLQAMSVYSRDSTQSYPANPNAAGINGAGSNFAPTTTAAVYIASVSRASATSAASVSRASVLSVKSVESVSIASVNSVAAASRSSADAALSSANAVYASSRSVASASKLAATIAASISRASVISVKSAASVSVASAASVLSASRAAATNSLVSLNSVKSAASVAAAASHLSLSSVAGVLSHQASISRASASSVFSVSEVSAASVRSSIDSVASRSRYSASVASVSLASVASVSFASRSSLSNVASVSRISAASVKSIATASHQASVASIDASKAAASASVASVNSVAAASLSRFHSSVSVASASKASVLSVSDRSIASVNSVHSASLASVASANAAANSLISASNAAAASSRASANSGASKSRASVDASQASVQSVLSASLASASSVKASSARVASISRASATSVASVSRASVASSRSVASVSAASVASVVSAAQAAPTAFYRYDGCFTYDTTTPPLSLHPSVAGLTLELCGHACYNHTYLGVVMGSQCYCGDTVLTAATTSDQCFASGNVDQCQGAPSEACGGFAGMAVYGRVAAIGACPSPSVAGATTTVACATVTARKVS